MTSVVATTPGGGAEHSGAAPRSVGAAELVADGVLEDLVGPGGVVAREDLDGRQHLGQLGHVAARARAHGSSEPRGAPVHKPCSRR